MKEVKTDIITYGRCEKGIIFTVTKMNKDIYIHIGYKGGINNIFRLDASLNDGRYIVTHTYIGGHYNEEEYHYLVEEISNLFMDGGNKKIYISIVMKTPNITSDFDYILKVMKELVEVFKQNNI